MTYLDFDRPTSKEADRLSNDADHLCHGTPHTGGRDGQVIVCWNQLGAQLEVFRFDPALITTLIKAIRAAEAIRIDAYGGRIICRRNRGTTSWWRPLLLERSMYTHYVIIYTHLPIRACLITHKQTHINICTATHKHTDMRACRERARAHKHIHTHSSRTQEKKKKVEGNSRLTYCV